MKGSPKIVDHVTRMEAWLSRHPGATWTRPQRTDRGPLGEHVVQWTQVSADPKQDGVAQQSSHADLGRLCDYLEALEASGMGITVR